LPASALGWLTSQYFGPEEASSIWASTRDKLRLLRFLLPRITHLRITRHSLWPPPLPDDSLSREPEARTPRHAPPPLEFLHTSSSSVCSALTTDTSFPTRQAFLDFMEMLQERPLMDLRLFPHLKVLVLDSVPPYWIQNFGSVPANQLQVLRIDKACLYKLPEIFSLGEYPNLTYLRFSACCVGEMSQLPKLLRLLPNIQFLSLADNQIRLEKTALKGLRKLEHLRKLDLSGNRLTTLPYANLFLGNITSLNLAGNTLVDVQGIDKLYGLEVLDLSDNQIADVSCLAGLGKLPSLQQLSVQGNPFLLKTPPGHNNFRPSRNARMQISTSAPVFEQDYRLLILSWFASNRASIQDLPILHGQPVTEHEMSSIRAMSVHQKYIPSKATTTTATKIQKVKRKCGRRGKAKIQPVNSMTLTKRGQLKSESSRRTLQPFHVSFTVYDVLDNMHQENRKAYPEDYESLQIEEEENEEEKGQVPKMVEEAEGDIQEDGLQQATEADSVSSYDRQQIAKEDTVATSKMSEDLSSTTEKETEPVHEETCSANKENEKEEKDEEDTRVVQVISPTPSPRKAPKSPKHPNSMPETTDDSELIESPSPVDTSTERQLREAVSQLSMSIMLDPDSTPPVEEGQDEDEEFDDDLKGVDAAEKDDEVANDKKEEGILICDGADNGNGNTDDLENTSPRKSKLADENIVESPPRVATVNLLSGGTRGQLDIFGADWDVLVQLAAEGLIPDGKLKTPVENVAKAQPDDDIFAAAEELLPGPVAARVSKLELLEPSIAGASSVITDDLSEIGSVFRSIAMDSAYQDDFSLPGFDASELQVPSEFQLAENNSVYDGPETCRSFNVLENMDLYFTSFVFRDPTLVSLENESANEDGELSDQVHPRIQLWPEDRKSIQTDEEASGLGDMSQNNLERCVRVWEEDVVPCGRSSLRRLGPNRNVRLTFHGDKVVKNSALRPYAESRKVYLCLSSDALYVIARKDRVTLKKKRKKFPLPIRDKAKFSDAPWPHAIARHSYHDLQAIVIGFDFQRLTLRFSSSRRRSDPYAYVLLTCNKRQTVSILQEIQHLKKESDEGVEELTSDTTAVAIENDSQVVFDALSEAVAPNMVGTIIHYQIVQQRWKHGNRGTVRRVCIVSDTKLFLLNEDYVSDGHKSLSNDGNRVGEVSYEVVDEATLAQVAEIRPADADPRSITILINPLSRLSRTHRWRLLCRDSDGAERLVAAVRRAIDMQD